MSPDGSRITARGAAPRVAVSASASFPFTKPCSPGADETIVSQTMPASAACCLQLLHVSGLVVSTDEWAIVIGPLQDDNRAAKVRERNGVSPGCQYR